MHAPHDLDPIGRRRARLATGNLDRQSADDVLAVFRRSNEKFGCAVLLVTHDTRISQASDRVVTRRDGKLAQD